MKRTILESLLLAALLATWSHASVAQPAELAHSDGAVRLGRVALDKFARREWAAAYEDFVTANRLVPSPVFVLYQARCKRRLGAWVEALGLYEGLLAHPLEDGAPQAFRDALGFAATEAGELRAAIPTLNLSVRGAGPEELRVVLDGKALGPAELARPVEVDPGVHHVLAVSGERGVARTIEVSEGQGLVDVVLELSTAPPSAAAPPAPVPPRPREPERAEPARTANWPALAGFTLGISGLVVGSVTGALAWSEARSVKENCDGSQCRPGDRSRRDLADRLGNVATAAFVVGAVGVGSGLVFSTVLAPSAGSASASALPVGRFVGVALSGELGR